MNNLIKISNLSKHFFLKKKISILKNINITIKKGDIVALVGPSGSGKSTFLHLLALLDKPSNGEIFFNNLKISTMSELMKDEIRGKKISIIYQQHNLLNDFTALENVKISMLAKNKNELDSDLQSKAMLKKVGLSKRYNHFPSDLSGGEQQRVAIARTLINKPDLILADEPTGNLDSINSREVLNLFLKLKSEKNTIIYATHNRQLAIKADYMLSINDGNISRINGKNFK